MGISPTGPKALSFATSSVRSVTSQEADTLGLYPQNCLLVTNICYLGTMSQTVHNLLSVTSDRTKVQISEPRRDISCLRNHNSICLPSQERGILFLFFLFLSTTYSHPRPQYATTITLSQFYVAEELKVSKTFSRKLKLLAK